MARSLLARRPGRPASRRLRDPSIRQLHVIPYYDPATEFGGVQTVCRQLVKGMVRRGHQVTLLTTDVASRSRRLAQLRAQMDGVEIVRVRNLSQRLVKYNLFAPLSLSRTLGELLRRCDFVHVHDVFNWLTFRTLERAERLGVPSVLSTDGLLSFDRRRGRARIRELLFRILGPAAIRRCQVVHAVRESELDCAALGIPKDKMRYIPNSAPYPPPTGDPHRFRERYRLDERTIILFVGQLLPMKGTDLVLELAQTLQQRRNLCFVFVGHPYAYTDEPLPVWRASNILFTGFLSETDLADAYAAASIYTLPSHYDVMPTTVLNALAHGIPCAVSRQCQIPEIAESGAGVLIEPT
ncbi:MAG TPA: glycosyltransferase, partial [Dehalococcoidia bacterium]|nr:glycosyltransferase [Dehalococcoidia bacterium]